MMKVTRLPIKIPKDQPILQVLPDAPGVLFEALLVVRLGVAEGEEYE
jgi:hypothetical protein